MSVKKHYKPSEFAELIGVSVKTIQRWDVSGKPPAFISEALNYNRKNWSSLLDSVMNGEIQTIIVSHKDRFVRFGFDWFENLCKNSTQKSS